MKDEAGRSPYKTYGSVCGGVRDANSREFLGIPPPSTDITRSSSCTPTIALGCEPGEAPFVDPELPDPPPEGLRIFCLPAKIESSSSISSCLMSQPEPLSANEVGGSVRACMRARWAFSLRRERMTLRTKRGQARREVVSTSTRRWAFLVEDRMDTYMSFGRASVQLSSF